MLNSKQRRFLKELVLKFPIIKIKRQKYLKNMISQYDYSLPVPSIICSTCIGGMISHNLGLKFMSPTINLWMTSSDLTKFCSRLDEYLKEEISFLEHTSYDFPVGKIGDITIYFQHYNSNKEANDKWIERKSRIDKDNIFIITDDNKLTKEEEKILINSKYKRLIIFTSDQNKPKPYFAYKCYSNKKLGKYSVRDYFGFAPFEKEFNYSAWLSGKENFRK